VGGHAGALKLGTLQHQGRRVRVAVLAGLQGMLRWTRMGRSIRAASSDPEAAALCGVDAASVHRAAAAISVALAALAGAMLATRATIEPYAGPLLLIMAFEAVVIGGIGSLWGTLLGGILLGLAQSFGALISPQGFQLGGHLLFLAVLGGRLWNQYRHGLGLSIWPTPRRTTTRAAAPKTLEAQP
jgi:branched-chain amino acid transport system permease protein